MKDLFARSMTKFFRFMADTFFAKRYGHRAVVLETVAGVPGWVAGSLLHLKSLRKMKTGYKRYERCWQKQRMKECISCSL